MRPDADHPSGFFYSFQWRRGGSGRAPREEAQEPASPVAFDELGRGDRRRAQCLPPSSEFAEAPRLRCPEDPDDGTWDSDTENEAPPASSPSEPNRGS